MEQLYEKVKPIHQTEERINKENNRKTKKKKQNRKIDTTSNEDTYNDKVTKETEKIAATTHMN